MTEKSLGELLELFDNAVGVSGYEGEAAQVLFAEARGLYDDYLEDAIGNQVYHIKGKSGGEAKTKSLLVAAHIDELGFMVSVIEESGLLRFFPIGFHDERLIINQELAVHTKNGVVCGVTGTKPPHLAKNDELTTFIPVHDMFIDIGVSSKEEAAKLGVAPGDIVSFARRGHFLNGTCVYSGKSVDNRAGLAVMIEVMRRLKKENSNTIDLYMVGTVQEEYGCRGALPVANRIKPDIAIVLDVSIAGDIPCIDFQAAPVKMGAGACIKFYESTFGSPLGMAVPQKLSSALIRIAEENNIPYQHDFMLGGITDGSTINFAAYGILCGGISFPSRYIHSAVGLVRLDDMRACADLLVAYIKSL
ncbi:MAG: M20/M25/M40 family metallo-hydrolase [Spirochaetaceae bacterium]|jgi:endoglucanase|nr:M20/M25/M40 family metallo-hydrolase [Spirochaetaceae bacterium]